MQLYAQDVKDISSGFPLDVQRQPPFNLEAEQALLGALLLRNDGLDHVLDFLEAVHFWDQLHGAIYDHAARLIGAGQRATPITLKTFFETAKPIDGETTVVQYLGRLAACAPTTLNIRDYGRVIYDLYVRRQLIYIGETVVEAAYDSPIDFPPKEQIEEAEMRLFSLVERGERGGEVSFRDATRGALQGARDAHTGKRTGIDTGLIDLDEKLGGMQPGDLLILAGRPGMGKSAWATNVARHIASEAIDRHGVVIAGKPVGFFSLEMGAEQIALRIMGDMANLSPDRIRRGKLAREELQKLAKSAPGTEALPIIIDPTGGLSIAQLSARARRMKRKHKVVLLIVDYLQLMHAGRRTENRVQDVSIITTGLKALAKELAIPVLALSQLSRAVEGRDNKRPQLSDLRESGSIEQDADVVMFVYREEYYLEQRKPPVHDVEKYADWNAAKLKAAGKAEVIIGKQRQGATGIVNVQFAEDLMRFSSLAVQQGEVRHG